MNKLTRLSEPRFLLGVCLGLVGTIPLALGHAAPARASAILQSGWCDCLFEAGPGEYVGDFPSNCVPTEFEIRMELEGFSNGTCPQPPCIDQKCHAIGQLSVEMYPPFCVVEIYKDTDWVVSGVGAIAIPVEEELQCEDFTDWFIEVGGERIARITNICHACPGEQ